MIEHINIDPQKPGSCGMSFFFFLDDNSNCVSQVFLTALFGCAQVYIITYVRSNPPPNYAYPPRQKDLPIIIINCDRHRLFIYAAMFIPFKQILLARRRAYLEPKKKAELPMTPTERKRLRWNWRGKCGFVSAATMLEGIQSFNRARRKTRIINTKRASARARARPDNQGSQKAISDVKCTHPSASVASWLFSSTPRCAIHSISVFVERFAVGCILCARIAARTCECIHVTKHHHQSWCYCYDGLATTCGRVKLCGNPRMPLMCRFYKPYIFHIF